MITFSEAELRVNIVKAMAHPVRLMVIEFILGGERSFSEISGLFHLDKSTISKHLLILKESGIISSRKTGREVIYKLEAPCVANFFTCATAVVQNKMEKQLKELGRGDRMGCGPDEKSELIEDTGLPPGKTVRERFDILYPVGDAVEDGKTVSVSPKGN